MTAGFLKRQDVAYPQQSNPRALYAAKLLEAPTLPELETAVNQYLFGLPSQTPRWNPHVISSQLLHYELSSGPQPRERFVMNITVYAVGTIAEPPT
jgi:hypothetical protein